MGGSGGGGSTSVTDVPREFKPAFTQLFNSALGASRVAAGQPGFGTLSQPGQATQTANQITGFGFGGENNPFSPPGSPFANPFASQFQAPNPNIFQGFNNVPGGPGQSASPFGQIGGGAKGSPLQADQGAGQQFGGAKGGPQQQGQPSLQPQGAPQQTDAQRLQIPGQLTPADSLSSAGNPTANVGGSKQSPEQFGIPQDPNAPTQQQFSATPNPDLAGQLAPRDPNATSEQFILQGQGAQVAPQDPTFTDSSFTPFPNSAFSASGAQVAPQQQSFASGAQVAPQQTASAETAAPFNDALGADPSANTGAYGILPDGSVGIIPRASTQTGVNAEFPQNLEEGTVGLRGNKVSTQIPLAAGPPIVGQPFGEQFTAGTSPLEFESLAQREAIARQLQGIGNPLLNLGNFTAQGGFLDARSNPFLQGQIEASLRPIAQNFQNSVTPNFNSQAISSGAFKGSSSRDLAFNQLASGFGQQLLDTGTGIAFDNYQRERGLQQNAGQLLDQGALLNQLTPELLAQVGLGQRELAQRPLDEALLQFQESVNAPFRPLFPAASIIFGGDIGSSFSQTVPSPSALSTGLIGALGGAGAGASIGGEFDSAGLGALLGGLTGGAGGLFG